MQRYACLSLALTLVACGDDPAGTGQTGETGGGGSASGGAAQSSGEVPTTAGPGDTSQGSATEAVTSSSGGPDATSSPADTGGETTTAGDETGDASTGDTTTGDDTTTGEPLVEFQVGVHVQDVSPTPDQISGNDIYMGAYGAPFTRGPAEGVHDPIYARSFAIEGNGGGLVMAIVDLPGMGNQVTRQVRQKVAATTGLAETQVLIGTTHSHSAPDFMGLWGGIPGDYNDALVEQTTMSMVAAWESRVPAELRVATGKAPANNRRDWGFTDDDMTVLDAFDLEQNRIGTMVVFAAHPVVLGEDNKEISCDYPGYMVQALEDAHGAPALLFNGVLGDASPKVPDGMYADDFARAEAYGLLLADIAVDLASGGEAIAEPTLTWTHAEWEQGVTNQLFQLASLLGILKYDFEMDGLNQKVTTQSTYFRLGTAVQGLAFPGEPLTRLGLKIKEPMKAPHRIILGNTGDALGYFVPSDEWQTGKNDNYEESVSLGKDAGDNAHDHIVPLIEADNAKF